MLFKSNKDLIGVDIGSSSVKLVQLRESKGGFNLVALGMVDLPPEVIVDNAIMDSGALADAIRGLVESLKIKTKNVATSVSGHSVIIRKIQLPLMTEDELEASIQWEAEQYIPFEVSEVNLDFHILGPDANDPSVMNVTLVAAKKDMVNDYVAVFNECGLTPVVMDIDCFALENAFESCRGFDDDEVVALINMGASAMNVNILKAGNTVFTRDVQVGGNMVNDEIQKRLGLNSEDSERAKLGEEVEGVDDASVREVVVSASESLAQEVQRSLDFFSATSSDEKVDKAFITGGVAKTSDIREMLEKRLGIPVEVFNPFEQMGVDNKQLDPEYIQAVGPLFTVGVGLAMRRAGDK